MKLQDRRAQRTKKFMTNALIELSVQKSYDEITIRDIVDKADIAYSTFFQHYRDKDALLRDIATETIDAFIEVVKTMPNRTPYEVGLQIFTHVIDHESLYHIFLNDQGVNRVFQEVQENLQTTLLSGAYSDFNNQRIPPEIIVNHVLSSIFALINWWLDHEKPYSIEQMAMIYASLIIRATNFAMQDIDSVEMTTLRRSPENLKFDDN